MIYSNNSVLAPSIGYFEKYSSSEAFGDTAVVYTLEGAVVLHLYARCAQVRRQTTNYCVNPSEMFVLFTRLWKI